MGLLLCKNDMRPPGQIRDLPLNSLSEAVKAKSLRSLNLSTRALNVLNAAGVTNIGQLVSRSGQECGQALAKGKASNAECERAVSALAKSIRTDGDVDWITYAETRGFLILPLGVRKTWTPRELIEVFPATATTAVRHRYGTNALIVLKSRVLVPAADRPTLGSVGKGFAATKEAVRLIERNLFDLFISSVRRDEYEGCRFRFRPEFVQPLQELISAVQLKRKRVYSFSDWQRVLRETWGVEPDELACAERLLLALVGLRKDSAALPHFFFPSEAKRSTLPTALRQAKRLLTQNHSQGLSLDEFRSALQRSLPTNTPTLSELSELVAACPNLEKDENTGQYRTRTECLKNSLDHYERILRSAGKPVHYLEIWQEAGRTGGRRHVSPATARSTLSGDPRFVPISRSGYWALSKWSNVETRSTPEIAAHILKGARRPMSERTLYTLVAARRPVNKRSIWSQLAADPRFLRAAPGMWLLADKSVYDA